MWANLLRTFQSAPYATGTVQIASQVQDVKPSSCLVVKSTQRAHNHNLPKPKNPAHTLACAICTCPGTLYRALAHSGQCISHPKQHGSANAGGL